VLYLSKREKPDLRGWGARLEGLPSEIDLRLIGSGVMKVCNVSDRSMLTQQENNYLKFIKHLKKN